MPPCSLYVWSMPGSFINLIRAYMNVCHWWNFYCQLADRLIDNSLDTVELRKRRRSNDRSGSAPSDQNRLSAAVGTDLVSISAKRKRKDGTETNYLYQGRCGVCNPSHKSKLLCSTCFSMSGKEIYLCYLDINRDCFG